MTDFNLINIVIGILSGIIGGLIIPLADFIRNIINDWQKEGRINLTSNLTIIPTDHIKPDINKKDEFIIIFEIVIINSGEDKQYLELSVQEDFFGKWLIKNPVLSIKNPLLKKGHNVFKMNMQSKLQPLQEMTKRDLYVVLIQPNGKYIKQGVKIIDFNYKDNDLNYKFTRLPIRKGKISIKDPNLEFLNIK